MFDMDHCWRDWRDNCISERSFRCTDLTFFDDNSLFWKEDNERRANLGDQNTLGQDNGRHGFYLMSSKDWEKMKEKMIEENKKAQEEFKKKKEEEDKLKSADELAQ
jgi:hypothetical protein